MKLRNQEDFWAGMMFIGFGVLAIVVSRNYAFGSAMRMGPGYFPTAIGICLIALGLIISVTAFKSVGQGIGRFAWRPMILLSVAFAAFAWGIEAFGFIPAMAVLIVLSALSGREHRWYEVLIETVVMIAGCWAIFIYGLELPFPLFGGR